MAVTYERPWRKFLEVTVTIDVPSEYGEALTSTFVHKRALLDASSHRLYLNFDNGKEVFYNWDHVISYASREMSEEELKDKASNVKSLRPDISG